MEVDSTSREDVLESSVESVGGICALCVERSGRIDIMDVRRVGG